jgi:AraC family ethanolamine operon transcriptional activator
MLAQWTGADPPDLADASRIIILPPAIHSAFRQILLGIIRVARNEPEILQSEATLARLTRSLLRGTSSAISAGWSNTPYESAQIKRDHQAILRRVDDYLRQRLGQPVYVPDLCRDMEISVRTLEYIFRECFDLTLIRYLKLRRLHAVRHALRHNHRAAGLTIRQTAREWGFHDLGRFAVEYKALYGESPSDTLRNQRGPRARPAA